MRLCTSAMLTQAAFPPSDALDGLVGVLPVLILASSVPISWLSAKLVAGGAVGKDFFPGLLVIQQIFSACAFSFLLYECFVPTAIAA